MLPPGITHAEFDNAEGTSMMKRPGSHRTVLSPKLVVDFVLNNGEFYFNGKRYRDEAHQRHNGNLYKRALGYGLSGIAKYVAKPLAQVSGTAWQNKEFYPMTAEYEFRPTEGVSIRTLSCTHSAFRLNSDCHSARNLRSTHGQLILSALLLQRDAL